MDFITNIDWFNVLNIVLSWFSALDFGKPIIFYGTMPLWAFPVTLLIYIAVFTIKIEVEENPHLHWTMKLTGAFAYFAGLLLDIYLNLVTMTIFMLDPPRELLVTSRLKRYHALDPSTSKLNWWRYHTAHFICTNWLNPFDKTGTHC